MTGNHPVVDSLMTSDNHLAHMVQNTVVYNAVAFVAAAAVAVAVVVDAAAAAAYFSSQIPVCTVPDSCQSWVSAYPAEPHVAAAAAAVRKAVGIEENYCCVDKGAVDAVGDSLDLGDMGFGLEGIHYTPFVADPEVQQWL